MLRMRVSVMKARWEATRDVQTTVEQYGPIYVLRSVETLEKHRIWSKS
jgi:hypothetical protein